MAFYCLSLLMFFLTRLALLGYSWNEANPGTLDMLKLFGSGLLFDSGFFAYAMIAPMLYFWLLPQKLWRSRWHGNILRLVIFAILYATSFVAVAECLLWEEFKVRFNFIAIDYLIYRREVTDNILQSYPMTPVRRHVHSLSSALPSVA